MNNVNSLQSEPIVEVSPPPKTSRKLAIAALVTGIVAVFVSPLPFAGAALGVAALILAILALKRRQPKGMSITGMVLGVIGALISIVVTIVAVFVGMLFSNLDGEFEAAVEWSSDEAPTQSFVEEDGALTDDGALAEDGALSDGSGASTSVISPEVPIRWDSLNTDHAPASTSEGSPEDPHPIGSRFTIGGWEVVVNFVDRDASESVLALAPENEPPAADERYVLLNVTLNNPGEEMRSNQELAFYYDTPKRLYPAFVSNKYHMITPDPALMLDDRHIGGNYSGYIAFRTDDVEGEIIRINTRDRAEELYVAVE